MQFLSLQCLALCIHALTSAPYPHVALDLAQQHFQSAILLPVELGVLPFCLACAKAKLFLDLLHSELKSGNILAIKGKKAPEASLEKWLWNILLGKVCMSTLTETSHVLPALLLCGTSE